MTPYVEARLWDDHDIPHNALMCEAVHRHGALAAIELNHNGPSASNFYSREVPIGPVHQMTRYYPFQARAMDREDIRTFRRWHREAAIRANARAWAKVYDGHSLVTLRKAIGSFDITSDYARVKAKLLYVIAPNDKLFPAAMGVAYAKEMREAGIDLTYIELVTDKGHMASHADAAQWAPRCRRYRAAGEQLTTRMA